MEGNRNADTVAPDNAAEAAWRTLSVFERDVQRVLFSMSQGDNCGWCGPNKEYTSFVLREAVRRFTVQHIDGSGGGQ